MKKIILLCVLFLFAFCTPKQEQLPYLGDPIKKGNKVDYPTISPFRFLNQEGKLVTNSTLRSKIYIADFIFLKCPTICPKMNMQLKRVYDVFEKDKEIVFVSHTIDPENDSIPALKAYADALNVKANKWLFLYGQKKEVYELAEKSYYAKAYKDQTAPGGYVHSGGFLLVDKKGHIRGVYDGTDTKDVDRLIKEIIILKKEIR